MRNSNTIATKPQGVCRTNCECDRCASRRLPMNQCALEFGISDQSAEIGRPE